MSESCLHIITPLTNLYPAGQEYRGYHQLSGMWPHSLIGQVQPAHADDCWTVLVVLDCLELHVVLNVLFPLLPVWQRYPFMLFKSNIRNVHATTYSFYVFLLCVCSTKSTTVSIKLGSCIDYHVVISTSVFCGNSCRGSVVKNNTVPLFSPSLCLTHSFGHDNEFWVVFKTGNFLRSLVNTSFFRRTLLHGVRWWCLAYTSDNAALLSKFNPYQSFVELILAVFYAVPGPMSNPINTLFWRVLCWFSLSSYHLGAALELRRWGIVWKLIWTRVLEFTKLFWPQSVHLVFQFIKMPHLFHVQSFCRSELNILYWRDYCTS